MRDFGGVVPAGPAISHAIPSNVFHDLKSDRWNSADYGVMLRRGDVELHAKLRDGTRLRDDACSSGALHCLRGHCTACGGIALLNCQCNGVLSGALVLYLVHRFVAMKPLTPLRPGLRAWVKPPPPLLARNVCLCGIVGEQRCRWFHVCP